MKVKIPTLMLHSVTQGSIGILHTKDDDWRSVKMDDYYDSYRLIAACLAYLDDTLDKEKGASEAPAPLQHKPN